MKTFNLSDELISIEPIIGIELGSEGVITGICDDLIEVVFIGGLLRYLYPFEIELKEKTNE